MGIGKLKIKILKNNKKFNGKVWGGNVDDLLYD